MAEETITLRKSRLVLRRLNTRCEMYGPIDPTPVLFHVKALADGTGFQACFASHWRDGTRDECIAWLDARVLELRAALLPPGAIVVSDTEETVERVARAIHAENVAACDGVTEWEDACESVRQFTMCQAGAVLAALRESRP